MKNFIISALVAALLYKCNFIIAPENEVVLAVGFFTIIIFAGLQTIENKIV